MDADVLEEIPLGDRYCDYLDYFKKHNYPHGKQFAPLCRPLELEGRSQRNEP